MPKRATAGTDQSARQINSPIRRIGALLALCGLIRGEHGAPLEDQRRAARRARVDWAHVLEVADELWVVPSLWRAVRDQGVALPPHVAERLREHQRANTVHNLRFRRRLSEVIGALVRARLS